MKVLVVHNQYRSAVPSGENEVVRSEVAALREAGIEVATFLRSSDEIDEMGLRRRAGVVLGPLTGLPSRHDMRDLLSRFEPDVVHVHNPYPLISPTAIADSHAAGARVVTTIHNFRLRCANGLFFRDGEICTDCEDRTLPIPAVLHGCYRGSRSQSLLMAAALVHHRRNWSQVDRFVAVSGFVAERLQNWGIAPERVVVKPNAVADPGPPEPLGSGFLFAGRLSAEKGIGLLFDAWRTSGLDEVGRLVIAGDGPLAGYVREQAASLRSVEFVGLQDRAGLQHWRRETAVQVMPSTWFEAHPGVAESCAAGRPVVAVGVGALATIVDDSIGWVTAPDASGLAAALQLASDPAALAPRAVAARRRYEDVYHPDLVTARLIDVYEELCT
jgi:glycosyltransferase involved in cell wall biosynthesis